MKILIVGASGMIGGEALIQCLAHPRITNVVAFVRRDLPADVSGHPKLEAMGSYTGSLTVDLEYPLAFLENMARVLETKPSRPQFRYVQLSGKFVRQNQEEKLWWGDKPRKLKGLLDTKALAIAKSHATIWKTFVVKPGGVVPKKMMDGGVLGAITKVGVVLGENWSIRVDELGAFMTYLAIDGEGEELIIENARIVRKGRELLGSQKDGSKS
ncbi:hypothetical protein F4819DRAFT_489123 [Hypoxylon fuscum]|nr:hypothetical protein F4819DRAFT_489123 [Hypoxylon fuscum]